MLCSLAAKPVPKSSEKSKLKQLEKQWWSVCWNIHFCFFTVYMYIHAHTYLWPFKCCLTPTPISPSECSQRSSMMELQSSKTGRAQVLFLPQYVFTNRACPLQLVLGQEWYWQSQIGCLRLFFAKERASISKQNVVVKRYATLKSHFLNKGTSTGFQTTTLIRPGQELMGVIVENIWMSPGWEGCPNLSRSYLEVCKSEPEMSSKLPAGSSCWTLQKAVVGTD